MDIVLFDSEKRNLLYPLTATIAVADLWFGMYTIKDWWSTYLGMKVHVLTEDYLQPLYGTIPDGEYLFIDANTKPHPQLATKIASLSSGRGLVDDKNKIFAIRTSLQTFKAETSKNNTPENKITALSSISFFQHPLDLVHDNVQKLKSDFQLKTANKKSRKIPSHVMTTAKENIFLAADTQLEHVILNASEGPIYIDKGALIMDGAILRGPIYVGENAVVKMGAKIYGGVTLGKKTTAGGEIKNSIISNYSNKAHDGYLGDAFIGRWCNLGGGTTNSNLKNTAGNVQMSQSNSKEQVQRGQKAGCILGDYSRTAINTSINTGSIFGVACNIFATGLTSKSWPHFSWGEKFDCYQLDKLLVHINQWMSFKKETLSEEETKIISFLHKK